MWDRGVYIGVTLDCGDGFGIGGMIVGGLAADLWRSSAVDFMESGCIGFRWLGRCILFFNSALISSAAWIK